MAQHESGWSRREVLEGAGLLAMVLGIPAAAVKLSRLDPDEAPSARQRALLREVAQQASDGGRAVLLVRAPARRRVVGRVGHQAPQHRVDGGPQVAYHLCDIAAWRWGLFCGV